MQSTAVRDRFVRDYLLSPARQDELTFLHMTCSSVPVAAVGMQATTPVDDFRLQVLYTEETEDALGPHWQLLQVRVVP